LLTAAPDAFIAADDSAAATARGGAAGITAGIPRKVWLRLAAAAAPPSLTLAGAGFGGVLGLPAPRDLFAALAPPRAGLVFALLPAVALDEDDDLVASTLITAPTGGGGGGAAATAVGTACAAATAVGAVAAAAAPAVAVPSGGGGGGGGGDGERFALGFAASRSPPAFAPALFALLAACCGLGPAGGCGGSAAAGSCGGDSSDSPSALNSFEKNPMRALSVQPDSEQR
jgi:hypothetical protein